MGKSDQYRKKKWSRFSIIISIGLILLVIYPYRENILSYSLNDYAIIFGLLIILILLIQLLQKIDIRTRKTMKEFSEYSKFIIHHQVQLQEQPIESIYKKTKHWLSTIHAKIIEEKEPNFIRSTHSVTWENEDWKSEGWEKTIDIKLMQYEEVTLQVQIEPSLNYMASPLGESPLFKWPELIIELYTILGVNITPKIRQDLYPREFLDKYIIECKKDRDKYIRYTIIFGFFWFVSFVFSDRGMLEASVFGLGLFILLLLVFAMGISLYNHADALGKYRKIYKPNPK